MKELVFDRTSWHFWIANFGHKRVRPEKWDDNIQTDICTYTRAVFWGLINFTLVALLFSTLGGLVLFSIGNLIGYFLFDYGLYEITKAVMATIAIVAGAIGALVGFCAIVAAYKTSIGYVSDKMADAKPGFVKNAYRSWKDKYCVKITINGE